MTLTNPAQSHQPCSMLQNPREWVPVTTNTSIAKSPFPSFSPLPYLWAYVSSRCIAPYWVKRSISKELTVKVIFLLLIESIISSNKFSWVWDKESWGLRPLIWMALLFSLLTSQTFFWPKVDFFFHFSAYNLSTITSLICPTSSLHTIWGFKLALLILCHANPSYKLIYSFRKYQQLLVSRTHWQS